MMVDQSREVQLKTVFLRRGIEIEKKFLTSSLIPGIESGNLLAADQISPDGKNWIKLGQHKQLVPFFNREVSPKVNPEKIETKKENATDTSESKISIWFIRIAYTLALNTGILTFITIVPKNPIHIFDVLLSFAFSIGIYNRSLFCAVGMLVYFLLSKGIQVFISPSFNSNEIIISIMLLSGYALGVLGVLRIEKKRSKPGIEIVLLKKFVTLFKKCNLSMNYKNKTNGKLFSFLLSILFLFLAIELSTFYSLSYAQVSILLKPSNIFALDFTPDGKYITSGNGDGKIRTWEVESGFHISTVKGHSFPILSLAYSPDGKFLATGGMDRKLKLWEADTGKKLITINEKLESKDLFQIAFSPDSQILASADGKNIKLWDVPTGKLIQTFEGHLSEVASLAFSPNGKLLASGAKDKNIKVWDVTSSKEILNLTGHTKRVGTVAFSPNNKFLASGADDKTAKYWEIATGKLIHTLIGHTNNVSSLAFSSNGETIITGSWDTTVRTWDTSNGRSILTISDHKNLVNAVKFYPKGGIFASGSNDGTMKLREYSTGSLVRSIKLRRSQLADKTRPSKEIMAWKKNIEKPFGNIALGKLISFAFNKFNQLVDISENSVAFSPDGKSFASIRKDKTVKMWDPKTGKSFINVLFEANSLTFSPDGKTLAIAGNPINQRGYWIALTGIQQTFSDANKKESSIAFSSIRRLNGHSNSINTVAFNPDGRTLASGSSDKTIIIWDAKSGSPLNVLKGHTGKIKSIAYSPNGMILASAGNDETIKLWSTKTGKHIRDLKGHSKTINTVAFHPSGKVLASGSNDQTVKTWLVETGQVLHDLKLRSNLVNSIAFHPNGKTLASGHWNETVNIIDFATGKILNTLKGHTSSINSISFSPNGKTLISGGRDKIVKVWETETGRLLNTIKGNTINKDADLLLRASNALAKNKSISPAKKEPQKVLNSTNQTPTKSFNTKFENVDGWSNKILPIHGSFFMTKIPSHWSQKPALNQSNEDLHIMGYFPKNTKLENWTEMITILGQKSKGRSIKQYYTRLYRMAEKHCTKENTSTELIKDTPELMLALLYCGGSTIEANSVADLKKNQGEITAYRIYKKGENLFSIAHAWRGKAYNVKEKDEKFYPTSQKKRVDFFVATNSTMICEKDSQQASCKESIKFFLTDLLSQTSKSTKNSKQNKKSETWSNLMLPVFGSFVMTQIPAHWAQKPAYNANNGKYHLIEFLPQGQTLKEWTEMISVNGLTKKDFTRKDYFNFIYLQNEKYCGKKNSAAEVLKETPQVFIATLYCGKIKEGTDGFAGLKKGQGEITAYRIYKKGDNLFSVFHSWRGKEFDVKSKNAKDYPGSIAARANYFLATNPTVICDKENPIGICKGYVSNFLKEAAGKNISSSPSNRLKEVNTKIKTAFKVKLDKQGLSGWQNIMLLLYNDFVITQIPENWPLLPEADSDKSLIRVIKFVPKNQTVKTWEEMIIVQAIRTDMSLKETYRINYGTQVHFCGEKHSAGMVLNENKNELHALLFCGKIKEGFPALKSGQGMLHAYNYYRKGKYTYSISHSWRGKGYDVQDKHDHNLPATAKTIAKYFSAVKSTQFCDIIDPKGSCDDYVSAYLRDADPN